MSGLRTAVAFIFQRAGREVLSEREIRHHASMDLRWFEPGEARRFVERCVDRGLLEAQDDGLAPSFDAREVEVPLGFEPKLASEGAASLETVLDRLIEATGWEREEAVGRVNREQAAFGGLVDAQVAALVVCREHGIPVDDLLDDVRDRGSA